MSKLTALFYPFVTRQQIEGIKLASLYFDEVYVLSPISVLDSIEFSKYYEELPDHLIQEFGKSLKFEHANAEVFKDESVLTSIEFQCRAKPLIDNGVVRIVNPFDEMKSLALADEFKKIIELRARQAIYLERTYQTKKLGLIRQAEELERAHIAKKLNYTAIPEMPSLGYSTATFVFRTGTPVCKLFSKKNGLLQTRTSAITTIMYDAALLLSSRYGTFPITADTEIDKSFALQAIHGSYSDSIGKMCLEHKQKREKQSFEIMRQSILDNVPAFENASFRDILQIREHCKEELISFRTEIKKLASNLSKNAKDHDTAKEIVDTVSRDITPIVTQMGKAIARSKSKWAKHFLDKLASIQTLATLTSTVFIGMPLNHSIVVALGVAGLQAGAETYYDTRLIKESSGLSFLITLKKRTYRK